MKKIFALVLAAMMLALSLTGCGSSGTSLSDVQKAGKLTRGPKYSESIEKELTEQYLNEYPEYSETFKVYWVKPDNGARFVSIK